MKKARIPGFFFALKTRAGVLASNPASLSDVHRLLCIGN
ncbi:hypothetical protein CFter6_1609 [Collimonas fungivorans]|uniref:Uncharacterized protein n=1 Tax=Collimonas fungivorans TaxID=158899 RepID=A0A127PA46_9BURK|nr:hypothetical protein CFter6_1609 [Collimonas fungivorans]